MADKRIDQLDPVIPAPLDVIPLVPNATIVAKKTTLQDVADMFSMVTNPGLSTDNAVPRYVGTTGKIIENTQVLINDDGSLNIPVFAAPRVGVINIGDVWLEDLGGSFLLRSKDIGGVVKSVELT